MTTCKYPGCDYDESDHRPYARLRDGVPSVTTVSSSLDTSDRGRAFAWSASLIAADMGVHHTDQWWNLPNHPCDHTPRGLCQACRFIRSEFDRKWKAKMALGGHIHHLALSWAKGEDADIDATTEPYMDALQSFYEQEEPEFLYLERTVRSDAGGANAMYRGQFDFIAKTNPLGHTGLWDIKTGGFYPVEQTLQLAAYRHANWLTIWDGRQEIKDKPMPYVDHAGVLMLRDDGSYELIELPADLRAYHRFTGLLLSWQWAKDIEKWNKQRKENVNG